VTTATEAQLDVPGPSFRHEALLYSGDADFADRVGGFVREAVDAGEPVLVAVGNARIGLLRQALGGSARWVTFVDMDAVGTNPARILPTWRTFAAPHLAAGRRIRGVGEPISPGRSAAELVECHRHEALLNSRSGEPSAEYRGRFAAAEPFVAPLSDPPALVEETTFMLGDLRTVRAVVAAAARRWGLPETRVADLLLGAGEVAANSVRHGGGRGTMRIWYDGDAAVCEIRDTGYIDEPLAGREPPQGSAGGYGLWLANQVCDLVQVRSSPAGTTVRLHVRARAA